jgi:hypothetical protein
MNTYRDLSSADLLRAATVVERIESLQAEFGAILGAQVENTTLAPQPGKRHMSAAGRAAIGAGAKARWAKVRNSLNGGHKPKRKMSAAAKAKLSAIARARWRKAKASGKTAL